MLVEIIDSLLDLSGNPYFMVGLQPLGNLSCDFSGSLMLYSLSRRCLYSVHSFLVESFSNLISDALLVLRMELRFDFVSLIIPICCSISFHIFFGEPQFDEDLLELAMEKLIRVKSSRRLLAMLATIPISGL